MTSLSALVNASDFELQERALTDRSAAAEYASRYAAACCPGRSLAHKTRVAAAWRSGLAGEPDPYALGRGGNFVAPLRSAWQDGRSLRIKLLQAVSS